MSQIPPVMILFCDWCHCSAGLTCPSSFLFFPSYFHFGNSVHLDSSSKGLSIFFMVELAYKCVGTESGKIICLKSILKGVSSLSHSIEKQRNVIWLSSLHTHRELQIFHMWAMIWINVINFLTYNIRWWWYHRLVSYLKKFNWDKAYLKIPDLSNFKYS